MWRLGYWRKENQFLGSWRLSTKLHISMQNLLLVDEDSFELICFISLISLVFLIVTQKVLLVTSIDPLAAQVQGIPVRATGLVFSIITACIVVSMVQVM